MSAKKPYTVAVLNKLGEGRQTAATLIEVGVPLVHDREAGMGVAGKYLSPIDQNRPELHKRKEAIVRKTLERLRIHGRVTESNGQYELAGETGHSSRERRIDLVPLDQIDMGDRQRKELGDIQGLAASIEALDDIGGLVHPIVLVEKQTENGRTLKLAAGRRRLAAYHHLGKTHIPARIFPALRERSQEESAAFIEAVENSYRLDEQDIRDLGEEVTRTAQANQKRIEEGAKAGGRPPKNPGATGPRVVKRRDESTRTREQVRQRTGLPRREAEGLVHLQKWATDKDADGGLVTLAQGLISDATEGKTSYAKAAKEHKRHVEAAQSQFASTESQQMTEPQLRKIWQPCEHCGGQGGRYITEEAND